jgi:diguanylate cyclase (GGDEF)-like protein
MVSVGNNTEPPLTDPHTGLWNWGGLKVLLHRELARAERNRDTIALMLLRIDQYDQLRKNHEPSVAASLVRQTAERLRESVRPSDLLGRTEDNLFVIFADGCSSPGAEAMATRIRARFAYDPFRCDGIKLMLTVSLGITVAMPTAMRDSQQMLDSARESLQIASGLGPGRMELAVLL